MRSSTSHYAVSKPALGPGKSIAWMTLQKDLGFSRIHMIARKNNVRGIKVYQRLGFVDSGEWRKDIKGTAVNFRLMDIGPEHCRNDDFVRLSRIEMFIIKVIKEEMLLMKTALLLIDIQNDYFPGGLMELDGSPEASLAAKKLLRLFRDRNLPIIHIQHISNRKGASFFLRDTAGVEIREIVTPIPGETIIRKNSPNSFRNTELLTHLKEADVNQLVICGMMSHMCVDATVRAAFDHGFDCVAIYDACATRGLAFNGIEIPSEMVHGAFMAALGAVYARVCSSDEFAAQIQ